MDIVIKLGECELPIAYKDSFKKKAVITMPIKNEYNLNLFDIVKLFEADGMNRIVFYNLETDPMDPEKHELTEESVFEGYSKLVSYNSNVETDLLTFQFEKPSTENMTLEEIAKYTADTISESSAVAQYSRAISVMSVSMTDEQVLSFADIIAEWSPDSVKYVENQVVRYKGNLYRVNKGQGHTSQESWNPKDAPSLWTMNNKENEGTLEDPIPVPEPFTSMEYVKGKYYIENDVLYLMNRDGMDEGEAITLTYKPSELVGQYFKVVE